MTRPAPSTPPRAGSGPASSPLFVLHAEGWDDFELIDSGAGRKLERYGRIVVDRPEPQAMWTPRLPESEWARADAVFTGEDDDEGHGRWRANRALPEAWEMRYGPARFICRFTGFRHVGVFPEQRAHWDWMTGLIRNAGRPVRVLNLFGYTGLASLLAAEAGARVTHVDASKKAIAWARENQVLSGMEALPIRWILDDAVKFTAREVRRGSVYEGIVLDPPKFGRGPKGEVWELFEGLAEMLRLVRGVLAPQPLFIALTAYAIRASFLAAHRLSEEVFGDLAGAIESGELALVEAETGRLLPTSMFTRWSAR